MTTPSSSISRSGTTGSGATCPSACRHHQIGVANPTNAGPMREAARRCEPRWLSSIELSQGGPLSISLRSFRTPIEPRRPLLAACHGIRRAVLQPSDMGKQPCLPRHRDSDAPRIGLCGGLGTAMLSSAESITVLQDGSVSADHPSCSTNSETDSTGIP